MEETRPVNVYKVELLIIDHDGIGEDEVKSVIENNHYPNHCMSPRVKKIETRQVDWSDYHPLNNRNTQDQTYKELFGG